MSAAAPAPPNRARGASLRVGAWVLYDLANTVYAAVLTFLFTPFARERLGGLSAYGAVHLASMAAAAALVPWLGALLDRTARTRGYLAITTLACIAALAGFGLPFGSLWLLSCFFVANLTYNLALLCYNALLPAVADANRSGRISGLGTGLGYLGTLVVLAVLLPLPVEPAQRFPVAAGMFLIGALPCLLLVRDPRRPQPSAGQHAGASALHRVLDAVRELPRRPALRWFLLANFCLVDVLNTAVLYFADFTTRVFAPAALAGELSLLGWRFAGAAGLGQLLQVLGVALNLLALLFGIGLGPWTDRAPLAVLRASALALALALVGGAWFGGHSVAGYLLTLVACGAFGLAGIWTAGRKVVVSLAPPERIGEYFGLYGITVKLSVLGSLLYGVVADAFGAVPAMLAQGVQLLLGVLCLAMVRMPAAPRSGAADA